MFFKKILVFVLTKKLSIKDNEPKSQQELKLLVLSGGSITHKYQIFPYYWNQRFAAASGSTCSCACAEPNVPKPRFNCISARSRPRTRNRQNLRTFFLFCLLYTSCYSNFHTFRSLQLELLPFLRNPIPFSWWRLCNAIGFNNKEIIICSFCKHLTRALNTENLSFL